MRSSVVVGGKAMEKPYYFGLSVGKLRGPVMEKRSVTDVQNGFDSGTGRGLEDHLERGREEVPCP